MGHYYKEKLNAQRMVQVYDTNIPRIRQYLKAEIDFIRERLSPNEEVLELGAGYGRIVNALAPYCKSMVGIELSKDNVAWSKVYLKDHANVQMQVMDAHKMTFSKGFDVVLCLQNGLSAMGGDLKLMTRMMTQLKPGGRAYVSTYSEKFWDFRLQWFEEQVQKGLLGEMDYEKTQNGIIVRKDGFSAITHSAQDFRQMAEQLKVPYEIQEVDDSGLFLILHKV